MVDSIKIETMHGRQIRGDLIAAGISAQVFTPKDVGGFQTVVIALGGAGTAAICTGVAKILKQYFEGVAKVEAARKITITHRGRTIEATSDTVVDILREISKEK